MRSEAEAEVLQEVSEPIAVRHEAHESRQEQEQEKEQEKIDDSEENLGVDVIESLCMRCGENGVTRMMMHKVPYFRELVIVSFHCDECGESNNEVTFGGEIQLQGCRFELQVNKLADLDRQVIKSDSASIRIPSLDFEIPPMTQKGEISTVEGFLRTAAKNLDLLQEQRLREVPEVGRKVAEIISALENLANGCGLPWTLEVDDPAGNSFVQNPLAPSRDPQLRVGYYYRSPEQDESLGLPPSQARMQHTGGNSDFTALLTGPGFGLAAGVSAGVSAGTGPPIAVKNGDNDPEQSKGQVQEYSHMNHVEESETSVRLGRSEVVTIPSLCPSCGGNGDSLTALTDIPHFKEVVIMAFDCPQCGYKNSEIRAGGAVPSRGTEVRLTVNGPDDLKRDVLKSDSAMVLVPELELELSHGTLGGIYTTVEGLLNKVRTSLRESNPFAAGDSARLHHSGIAQISEVSAKFEEFLSALEACARGDRLPFTLVLRDPLGNSFVSAPLGSFLPPEADTALSFVDFDRSYEEDEEFGLNDINTRDFETGVDRGDDGVQLPVLSDRLTQRVPQRVVDHPSFFAKGIDDSTPGGAFLGPRSEISSTATVPSIATGNCTTSSAAMTSVQHADSPSTVPVTTEPWFSTETLPLGWVALKPGQTTIDEKNEEAEEESTAIDVETHIPSFTQPQSSAPSSARRRTFNPEDKNLQFDPREEFAGRRPGFVFRLGLMGLGYYEDAYGNALEQQKKSKSTNHITSS